MVLLGPGLCDERDVGAPEQHGGLRGHRPGPGRLLQRRGAALPHAHLFHEGPLWCGLLTPSALLMIDSRSSSGFLKRGAPESCWVAAESVLKASEFAEQWCTNFKGL